MSALLEKRASMRALAMSQNGWTGRAPALPERYLPRSASWIEEMEKRSRRRIRDLVAQPASLGLSENEIGCARISMVARNTNVPFKGRIQKRKTYHLQIITLRLQRAAGPYRSANHDRTQRSTVCARGARQRRRVTPAIVDDTAARMRRHDDRQRL